MLMFFQIHILLLKILYHNNSCKGLYCFRLMSCQTVLLDDGFHIFIAVAVKDTVL
jgi:hypothetical protein